MQINGEIEMGNDRPNIGVGHENMVIGNSVQGNQTIGNNGNILSPQNINLIITENEIDDEFNSFPTQTNLDYTNGGLVSNDEYLFFQSETYPSTENNEDRLDKNFNSDNYSSNQH